MPQRICMCYFSPCGNVKKTVSAIANKIAMVLNIPIEEFDFTPKNNREKTLEFGENDLVVIGTPVYAGRVPNKIISFITENIKGKETLCLSVVCYGNRSCDDALTELVNTMKNNGFIDLAAASVVTEHSFADKLATGRPDSEDINDLENFGKKVSEKILSGNYTEVSVPGVFPCEKYYTPLKTDGTPAKFLKATPVTDTVKCVNCGACVAACPMGSVDSSDVSVTTGICIKCQACIKACPVGARYFDDEAFLSHKEMLVENYYERKESVFFI